MRTVLFDLDGTLVDSAEGISDHVAAALASVGGPTLDRAALRALAGPPFEVAFPALGLDEERSAAAIAAYRASYGAVAHELTPPFPGVPELLDRLRAAGLRLTVATSKPEPLAVHIVEANGLAPAFALVGGSDAAGGRVGKAKVVGSVLERLADPGPTVMVGDRMHDVEGAAAHGIGTVGVAWGYAQPGELAPALAVVPDVDALADLLLDDAVWTARRPARC